MSEIVEVNCDGCGADLSFTANSEDWRLALIVQPKSPRYNPSRTATLMSIKPPLTSTKHFCSLLCLDTWRQDSVG